jgi:hypothetical protein
VPAKAQGDRAIALRGEIVEKVLVPARGRVLASVDEKQWHRMRFAGRSPVNYFKHDCLVRTMWSGFPAAD